jgi:hypothetical protein
MDRPLTGPRHRTAPSLPPGLPIPMRKPAGVRLGGVGWSEPAVTDGLTATVAADCASPAGAAETPWPVLELWHFLLDAVAVRVSLRALIFAKIGLGDNVFPERASGVLRPAGHRRGRRCTCASPAPARRTRMPTPDPTAGQRWSYPGHVCFVRWSSGEIDRQVSNSIAAMQRAAAGGVRWGPGKDIDHE